MIYAYLSTNQPARAESRIYSDMSPIELSEFRELLKHETAQASPTARGKMYRFADGSHLWLMGSERKLAARRAIAFKAQTKTTLDNIVADLFA